MAVEGQFLTLAGLEARFGACQVLRHLDDTNNGSVDEGAAKELIDTAEARVLAYMPPNYTVDTSSPDKLLVALGYDVAIAMLIIRHPEITQQDGIRLLNQAIKELKSVATGETSFHGADREDVTPTIGDESGGTPWNDVVM